VKIYRSVVKRDSRALVLDDGTAYELTGPTRDVLAQGNRQLLEQLTPDPSALTGTGPGWRFTGPVPKIDALLRVGPQHATIQTSDGQEIELTLAQLAALLK